MWCCNNAYPPLMSKDQDYASLYFHITIFFSNPSSCYFVWFLVMNNISLDFQKNKCLKLKGNFGLCIKCAVILVNVKEVSSLQNLLLQEII